LAAVAMNRRPLLDGVYWMDDGVPVDMRADTLLGINQFFFAILSRICVLSDDLESGAVAVDAVMAEGMQLEHALFDWTSDADCDPSLHLAAEAYRSATLITLYRLLRRFDAEYGYRDEVHQAMQNIIHFSSLVPSNGIAESSLAFPLFIAGGEALVELDMQRIRDRLHQVHANSSYKNVLKVLEVLEDLWMERLSGGVDTDWLHTLHKKGWNLNLA